MNIRKIKEFIIERLIFLSGIASIVFVILIFSFLLKEGISFFKEESAKDFIGGRYWYPISEPARFGMVEGLLGQDQSRGVPQSCPQHQRRLRGGVRSIGVPAAGVQHRRRRLITTRHSAHRA